MNNKTEIKQELEKQIIAAMLYETNSIPIIYQKIQEEDFSKLDRATEMESNRLLLELSRKNIKGYNLPELMKLQEKNFTLERLIFNKVFEQFLDLVFSLKAEDFLKDKLKQVQTDVTGFDTLTELKADIETLLKRIDNFKEEKSFAENLPNIKSEIEEERNSKINNSLTVKNIPSFNTATGGLRPSNLIGIAGAYKSGKTGSVSV
jgi:hypothetical protein